MSQLRLYFTGLCGFVPRFDIKNPNNRMQVLFRTVPKGHLKYPEHIAACVGIQGDGMAGRTVAIYTDLSGTVKRYCLFSQETIEIRPDGNTLPDMNLQIDKTFELVAPLPLTAPGHPNAGTIKKEDLWIANTQVPNPQDVNATVILANGLISTKRIVRNPDGSPANWTFQSVNPVKSPYKVLQLAEEVLLVLDFTQFVTLHSTPWSGAATKDIVLTPLNPSAGLDVYLKNLSKKDTEENGKLNFPATDSDFEEFYLISQDDPKDKNRPVPVPDSAAPFKAVRRRKLSPGKPNLSNPWCPPARFAPDPNA